MEIKSFYSPEILFGSGSLSLLGKKASTFGKRAFILTGPFAKGKTLEEVQKSLSEFNVVSEVFSDIVKEPDLVMAEALAQKAKAFGADIVIGIGGGSVLDLAKSTALGIENGVRACLGVGKAGEGVPKILIPTTAGTGSEATNVSVINTAEGKGVIYSVSCLPELAVVDPILTLTMPSPVTAATGLDALGHSIASYTSLNATKFSQPFSIQAIQLIGQNLEPAFANGSDIKAREGMAMGANLAGIGMTNAGVKMDGCPIAGAAAEHAIALALADYAPHGVCVALGLLATLPSNIEIAPESFREVAKALGVSAPENVFSRTKEMIENTSLPKTLRQIGVKETELERIAEGSMKAQRLLANNPAQLTKEKVLVLLKSIF